MMLSRVAERIYWAARYLERAENTARLSRVYGALLLDLPSTAGFDWPLLVDITGGTPASRSKKARSDRTTLRHLLADPDNPGSALSSLRAARENFRTTRDLAPSEAWRRVNELYLYGKDNLRRAVFDRRRHEVLLNVTRMCQEIRGMLADGMTHGDAYQFLRLGRSIERADMTTRVIDVAVASLMSGRSDLEPFQNSLWIAVLRSLSGYQMYRQQVRHRVVGRDVIAFLLLDLQFPRAVGYCLAELDFSLRSLPRYEAALRGVLRLQRIIGESDLQGASAPELHDFIDAIQRDLAGINEQIALTWFLPDEAA
jgi:uncharacterized alpha-E superfamily protein